MDALRHGWPLAFKDGAGGTVTLLPVETTIARGATAPRMLISAARAATLKLANQRDAAVPHAPVLIRGGEPFGLDEALPIADPALDLGNPFKGPFKAEAITVDERLDNPDDEPDDEGPALDADDPGAGGLDDYFNS